MSHLPLNGERLLGHLESSLRQSPAVSLAQALAAEETQLDDVPDGTNGSVKSYEPPQRATDPSQGKGNPRRLSKAQDPLLESLTAVVNRRSIF